MSVKVDILWRAYLVFFAVCAFGAAILVQAYRVQTVRGDHWLTQADSVYLKYRSIDAQRGNILSADGRLLATTLPTFDIRMDLRADGLDDATFRNNIVSLSTKLANKFPSRSAKSWERKLTQARGRGDRYYLIKRRVDYSTMLEMKQWPIWDRGRYKGGLIVEDNNTRKAPFGQLAYRTIGYSKNNSSSASGVGLEASYNDVLKGVEGQRLEQRIAGGTWVPVGDKNEVEPKNGSDITTTIDVNVQDVAESTLESVLRENKADWGTAIVMEVATGEIKAIANLTRTERGNYIEDFNYAIGYKGEPGSTMKLATLAALLEDDYVSIQDSVDIHNGKIRLAGRNITDSEGWNPYRKITIKRAFERSSNVAFTSLAYKYYNDRPKKFLKHLEKFNFDQPFGVEVQGEKAPFYRQPGDEGWSAMSIPSISFGYEILMTPLQMLAFYNAVANDGELMKPYLVKSITERGRIKKSFKPTTLNSKICSQATIDQLKECLVGVVEQGTGKSLQSPDYQAAGKTGTTRLAVPGEGYGRYYTASFAGFFPAENPKYSAIVVVNKPTAGKYYGSSVAGPVFKAVADMLYARSLDIQQPINYQATLNNRSTISGSIDVMKPIEKEVFQGNIDSEEYWLNINHQDTTTTVFEHVVAQNKVPSVLNMGADEALYMLENLGLSVNLVGTGIVRSQSIKPGAPFRKGQVVTIKLDS